MKVEHKTQIDRIKRINRIITPIVYIDFKKKIDQGRYFTVFAPRQMGKTTFLKDVIRNINQDDYYIGINMDFELIMYGLIKEGEEGNTEIANSIYKKVLLKTFVPSTDRENFFPMV